MKINRKSIVLAALMASMCGSSAIIGATAAGSLAVSAEASQTCEVTADPITFNITNLPTVINNYPATSAIGVICSSGIPSSTTLDFDAGINADVGGADQSRYLQMENTSERIPYQLYSDAIYTSALWGANSKITTVLATQDISAQVLPMTKMPLSGTYTDTVTLTLNY